MRNTRNLYVYLLLQLFFQVNPNILQSSSGVTQPPAASTAGSGATAVPLGTPNAVELPDTKEDGNKYAALSSYLGSPTHSSDPGSPNPFSPPVGSPPPPGHNELASPCPPSKLYPYLMAKGSSVEGKSEEGIANVVDRILEQRKKLRQSSGLSRMYKVPFEKKISKRVKEEAAPKDPGIKYVLSILILLGIQRGNKVLGHFLR